MTGDGKSSRGTGRKSRSGKTCETSRLFNPYRTMLEKGEYVEGFKEDEVHDALTKNPAPKGPPLLLISSALESPARMLASLDGEPDLPENGQDSSSSSPESCENYSPAGSSSRTFQACFLLIKDLISLSSSIRWPTSAMGGPTEYSIVNSSESPRDAAECSLSDILVAHAHPKYSLSPKAAAGILRRAERRGRDLPTHLAQALMRVSLTERAAAPTSPPLSKPQTGITATQDQKAMEPTTLSPKPSEAIPDQEATASGALLPNPCAPTDGAEVTAMEMRGMSLSTGEVTSHESSLATPMAAEVSGSRLIPLPTLSMQEVSMSVRRLTPTECERLQSLPDGWTHVHGAPMVGATPLWETLSRLWWPDGSGGES
jgi:hypothetical protein